jgi:hypothetical protein
MIIRDVQPGSAQRYGLQWRLGALCLSLGLMLKLFCNPADQVAQNVSHFVTGMLIGIALVSFLMPQVCRVWSRKGKRPSNQ